MEWTIWPFISLTGELNTGCGHEGAHLDIAGDAIQKTGMKVVNGKICLWVRWEGLEALFDAREAHESV